MKFLTLKSFLCHNKRERESLNAISRCGLMSQRAEPFSHMSIVRECFVWWPLAIQVVRKLIEDARRSCRVLSKVATLSTCLLKIVIRAITRGRLLAIPAIKSNLFYLRKRSLMYWIDRIKYICSVLYSCSCWLAVDRLVKMPVS